MNQQTTAVPTEVLGYYGQVRKIIQWLALDREDRPSPELTHHVIIRVKGGRDIRTYLTEDQFHECIEAELKYELACLNANVEPW